jgi:protein-disulfide isomerase
MEKNNLMIPGAIVLAGIIVAFALFASRDGGGEPMASNGAGEEQAVEINIKPISEDDHILGNPNADIVIVEFSDLECPFCKNFHETMNQIINEFGKDGKVAWVYRHFPLTQLHPKAQIEAEATECAGELGGNASWWDYTNRLFEVTPSNNGLNNGLELDELPQIAEDVGLNRADFEECLESGRQADTVQAQFDDAIASGGRGTPYNVLILKDEVPESTKEIFEAINTESRNRGHGNTINVSSDGDKVSVSGGQSFEVMSLIISDILAN